MPEPLTLQLEQSRRYLPGDYAQVEVDGEVQSDAFVIWGADRYEYGFGRGPFGRGRLGYGRALTFGRGSMGRGTMGQGARVLTFRTRAKFQDGDYSIRLRVIDRLGNAGAWSAAVTLNHRPVPPPPFDLKIVSGDLRFKWTQSGR